MVGGFWGTQFHDGSMYGPFGIVYPEPFRIIKARHYATCIPWAFPRHTPGEGAAQRDKSQWQGRGGLGLMV